MFRHVDWFDEKTERQWKWIFWITLIVGAAAHWTGPHWLEDSAEGVIVLIFVGWIVLSLYDEIEKAKGETKHQIENLERQTNRLKRVMLGDMDIEMWEHFARVDPDSFTPRFADSETLISRIAALERQAEKLGERFKKLEDTIEDLSV